MGDNAAPVEEWRKINDPFSRYSVSDMGRIRNDKSGYIFAEYNGCLPYPSVSLVNSITKKPESKLTHILVAQQFIGYTPNMQKDKTIVANHINANKMDAKLTNLKIITTGENNMTKKINGQGRKRPVQQFNMDGNFIAEFPSAGEVGPQFPRKSVSDCCNGKTKSTGGFIFRHKPDPDLEGEIWKEMIFNGKSIKASTLGRVEKLDGVRTYGSKNNQGYMKVNVCGKEANVHRIICAAFHPIDNPNIFVVHHIDHNKSNNRADNLEWSTQSGNVQKWLATNPNLKARNVIRKAVVRINSEGVTHFISISEASEQTPSAIDPNIAKVCKGIGETAGGYGWMYLSDYNKKTENEGGITFIDKTIPKPIVSISKDGTVKTYLSAHEAEKVVNSHGGIYNVLNGKATTSKGRRWMFENDYKKMVAEEKVIEVSTVEHPVVGISIDNTIKIYPSISQAARETGAKSICSVLNGKLLSSGGCQWITPKKYEECTKNGEIMTFTKRIATQRSVVGIDKNGSATTYQSIVEAEKAIGSKGGVGNVLSNRSPTYKGYRWMYLEDYEALQSHLPG